jgi:hypothetical protein
MASEHLDIEPERCRAPEWQSKSKWANKNMSEEMASELCAGDRIMARTEKAPMCMQCVQKIWTSCDRDLLVDIVMFHQNAPESKKVCSYKTMIEWWEYWLLRKKARLPEIELETEKNKSKHVDEVDEKKRKAFNVEEHPTLSMKRCLQSLSLRLVEHFKFQLDLIHGLCRG